MHISIANKVKMLNTDYLRVIKNMSLNIHNELEKFIKSHYTLSNVTKYKMD